VLFPSISPNVLGAAQAVRAQFADLEVDLADAVNVVLAAEYQTNAILTLDHRDYRAVTPLSTHDALLLQPDDADTATP
jgi:predicted nucleic acid-binding protein